MRKKLESAYSSNLVDKVKLTSCTEVFQFILSKWDLDVIEFQEECKIILVNRANFVLGIYELSKGGISGTVVDVRIILSVALKCNASGIIMVHNHPSGNIKPSVADSKITRRLKDACDLLEISLIDHIIISRDSYFSFTQDGFI